MDSKLKKNLDLRWEEYERLRCAEKHYAAVLRIADIFGSLESLTPDDQALQEKRCQQVPLDEIAIEAIKGNFEKQERKIARILSIGEKWNEDELLLVITIRIQNDLIRNYLLHRGYSLPETESNQTADLFNELSASPVNQRAFSRAVRLARKNWGLTIQHSLLKQ